MSIFSDLMKECEAVTSGANRNTPLFQHEGSGGVVNNFARNFVSGFYAPRNIQRAQAGMHGPKTPGRRKGPSDPGPDFGPEV